MTWARVDDGAPGHRKFLRLRRHGTEGLAAIGLWSMCLAWAHQHTRTLPEDRQGIIPPEIVEDFGGPDAEKLAALLAAPPPGMTAGLWEPLPHGCWRIHDFRYWQELGQREVFVQAGRRGAAKRWGTPLFDLPEDAPPNGVANRGATDPLMAPTPTHPNPTPTPKPKTGSPLTQRAQQLAKLAYDASHGMLSFPAVQALAKRAINAGDWTDDQIGAALLALVRDDRPITLAALRVQLRQDSGPREVDPHD